MQRAGVLRGRAWASTFSAARGTIRLAMFSRGRPRAADTSTNRGVDTHTDAAELLPPARRAV
jgi:hypothetical protein